MNDALRQRIFARKWFYEFELPDGTRTESYVSPEVKSIHPVRYRVLADVVRQRFGGDWSELRCVDLACHEGFFTLQLALGGCREVLGLDGREEHVDNAALISRAYDLANLEFARADIETLDPGPLGTFDVTLLFGVLYHVHDAIGLLRTARALTRGVCVIETQVAPDLGGELEWGSVHNRKSIEGCFAIVDESSELRRGNREASISGISLVPSLRGLLWLLGATGFAATEILQPPRGAYEQFDRGRRVMIAATPARSDRPERG